MDINGFNSLLLNTLSEKLLPEKNKEIVLMGDFNVNILKYEEYHNTPGFLELIYSTILVRHITSPTQITSRSRILIDNIFFNRYMRFQYLFLPTDQLLRNQNKDIYQCNYKHFDQQTFLEDISNLN